MTYLRNLTMYRADDVLHYQHDYDQLPLLQSV